MWLYSLYVWTVLAREDKLKFVCHALRHRAGYWLSAGTGWISLSLFIGSLYVWTVSLTDADRATRSPMGSLCPVLTLYPRAFGSSQGKGGCWSVLVRAGCLDCVRSRRKKPEIPDEIRWGIWGDFRLGRTEKRTWEGLACQVLHILFLFTCVLTFLSCLVVFA